MPSPSYTMKNKNKIACLSPCLLSPPTMIFMAPCFTWWMQLDCLIPLYMAEMLLRKLEGLKIADWGRISMAFWRQALMTDSFIPGQKWSVLLPSISIRRRRGVVWNRTGEWVLGNGWTDWNLTIFHGVWSCLKWSKSYSLEYSSNLQFIVSLGCKSYTELKRGYTSTYIR